MLYIKSKEIIKRMLSWINSFSLRIKFITIYMTENAIILYMKILFL